MHRSTQAHRHTEMQQHSHTIAHTHIYTQIYTQTRTHLPAMVSPRLTLGRTGGRPGTPLMCLKPENASHTAAKPGLAERGPVLPYPEMRVYT